MEQDFLFCSYTAAREYIFRFAFKGKQKWYPLCSYVSRMFPQSLLQGAHHVLSVAFLLARQCKEQSPTLPSQTKLSDPDHDTQGFGSSLYEKHALTFQQVPANSELPHHWCRYDLLLLSGFLFDGSSCDSKGKWKRTGSKSEIRTRTSMNLDFTGKENKC